MIVIGVNGNAGSRYKGFEVDPLSVAMCVPGGMPIVFIILIKTH